MPDDDIDFDETRVFDNLTSDSTIAWLEEILRFAKAHRGKKVVFRDYANDILERLEKRGYVKPEAPN